MAYNKKTWKDRQAQYPNRRILNDGYSQKTVNVYRSEGHVYQAGDAFSAANMNDLEMRIENAISGSQPLLTAGENIDITNNVISVTDLMSANDAHTVWNNA